MATRLNSGVNRTQTDFLKKSTPHFSIKNEIFQPSTPHPYHPLLGKYIRESKSVITIWELNMSFLGTKDVARLLGIKASSLSRVIWEDKLAPPQKGPGGAFLWTLDDIRRASWVLLRKDLDEQVIESELGAPTEIIQCPTTDIYVYDSEKSSMKKLRKYL